MQLFGEIGEREASSRARATAILCFLIPGTAAALGLPLAVSGARDPVRAISWAFGSVGALLAITGVVGWSGFARLALLRPFMSVIVWMAPLAVFGAQGTLEAVLAAALFASMAARLLREFRDSVIYPDETNTYSDAHAMGMTLVTSIAYLGVAAGMRGDTAAAAVLIGISCSVVAWLGHVWVGPEGRFHETGRPSSRVWLHVGIAIALTFAGLTRALPGYQGQHSTSAKAKPKPSNLQSGVILLSEPKPLKSLVAPRPVAPRSQAPYAEAAPASIPFSGEYWFFYWPLRRPSASALVERGDPISFTMTSTDATTLVMQARQNIDQAVDIRCCRRIDVILRGKDPKPGTVIMELVLIDSSRTDHNSQRLGAEALGSALSTFSFAIPAKSAIQSFDQILVWFHLEEPRRWRSAKVALDRFDLIP